MSAPAAKKKTTLKEMIASAVGIFFVISLMDVLRGKKTIVEWLYSIPAMALAGATLLCCLLLGARLHTGGTPTSLWRRWSDVIGCLGIGYLGVITFASSHLHLADAYTVILVGSGICVAVGYGLSAKNHFPSLESSDKALDSGESTS